MHDPMLPLPGLSSASGKPVVVKFDGGLLSWDGGVLALREVEQRLRVGDRLAACMIDPRAADQITDSLADVIRFRLLNLLISAGCEDGNDAHALRRDPMFKMALDLSPIDREQLELADLTLGLASIRAAPAGSTRRRETPGAPFKWKARPHCARASTCSSLAKKLLQPILAPR